MNKALPTRFVIRVYALIINDLDEVLISDEYQLDTRMTKFPGGGLEFGEGTLDCLHREALEELGQDIEVTRHFYTTDYYQQALYYEDAQLLSIYYLARLGAPARFKISRELHDYPAGVNGGQSFRWVKRDQIDPGAFTFPIDRKVATLLISATIP